MLAIRASSLEGPVQALVCPEDVTQCVRPDRLEDLKELAEGVGRLEPRPPYKAVGVMSFASGPFGDHSLEIRTSAGWYLVQLFFTNMAVSGAWTGSAEIESMKCQDVIAGGPSEILLTYHYSGASGGAIAPKDHEERVATSLLICGIGANQIPACTEPIVLAESTQKGESDVRTTYELKATFVRPDSIELTHVDGTLPDSVRAMLGKHRIVMP